MTETLLPVPSNVVVADHHCRHLRSKGRPCGNVRQEGSDFCHLHQPRALPAPAADQPPVPFPEPRSAEELTTPEGIHAYLAEIVAYIAHNDQADLPRVYALQAYAAALLRSAEPAQLSLQLAEARQEVDRLTRAQQNLLDDLQRERTRPQPPAEAELQALRSRVTELTQHLTESERSSARHHDLREELETVATEQVQLREAAEQTLAAHLERLRKAHNTLCYGCGVRLRPLIGGDPKPGDIDHVERTEYIGRTGW